MYNPSCNPFPLALCALAFEDPPIFNYDGNNAPGITGSSAGPNDGPNDGPSDGLGDRPSDGGLQLLNSHVLPSPMVLLDGAIRRTKPSLPPPLLGPLPLPPPPLPSPPHCELCRESLRKRLKSRHNPYTRIPLYPYTRIPVYP